MIHVTNQKRDAVFRGVSTSPKYQGNRTARAEPSTGASPPPPAVDDTDMGDVDECNEEEGLQQPEDKVPFSGLRFTPRPVNMSLLLSAI